jgi:hypothetical protein
MHEDVIDHCFRFQVLQPKQLQRKHNRSATDSIEILSEGSKEQHIMCCTGRQTGLAVWLTWLASWHGQARQADSVNAAMCGRRLTELKPMHIVYKVMQHKPVTANMQCVAQALPQAA